MVQRKKKVKILIKSTSINNFLNSFIRCRKRNQNLLLCISLGSRKFLLLHSLYFCFSVIVLEVCAVKNNISSKSSCKYSTYMMRNIFHSIRVKVRRWNLQLHIDIANRVCWQENISVERRKLYPLWWKACQSVIATVKWNI